MSQRGSISEIYSIEGMRPPEHEPEPDYETADAIDRSNWSHTGPESSISQTDQVSSVSADYEKAKQKEYKQKLIVSLAMLLPAVAAIIGK